jgi:hypothetical protein
VSQWYIFNDFTINPIPPEEAVWFNLKWKIPCIICFTADLLPSSLEKLFYKVRASASLFVIFILSQPVFRSRILVLRIRTVWFLGLLDSGP